LVAGGDWGRGTLKTALAQRPTRLAPFAGQALAVLAALAAGALASSAVGAAFSLLVSALEAGAASPDAASFPAAAVVARGISVALLISVTYGALGLALGTLFRGAGLAIGVALLLAVVLQALLDTLALQVRGAFEAVNNALPGANVLTLTGTFGSVGGGPDTQVLLRTDPAIAAWVLVGYAIAFLALGAIVLLRRDVA